MAESTCASVKMASEARPVKGILKSSSSFDKSGSRLDVFPINSIFVVEHFVPQYIDLWVVGEAVSRCENWPGTCPAHSFQSNFHGHAIFCFG